MHAMFYLTFKILVPICEYGGLKWPEFQSDQQHHQGDYTQPPVDKNSNIPLDDKRCFCLKASRRPMLAQSQNPSGKPGGNSKAANAFVRNVCQRMGCCYCRNIFRSLASGPSNLDPKKGAYSSVNGIML